MRQVTAAMLPRPGSLPQEVGQPGRRRLVLIGSPPADGQFRWRLCEAGADGALVRCAREVLHHVEIRRALDSVWAQWAKASALG